MKKIICLTIGAIAVFWAMVLIGFNCTSEWEWDIQKGAIYESS